MVGHWVLTVVMVNLQCCLAAECREVRGTGQPLQCRYSSCTISSIDTLHPVHQLLRLWLPTFSNEDGSSRESLVASGMAYV